LIIGRKPGEDIDIVCDGKTVSRKHCALSFNEDHWEIEDMGVRINFHLYPFGLTYFTCLNLYIEYEWDFSQHKEDRLSQINAFRPGSNDRNRSDVILHNIHELNYYLTTAGYQ